MVIHNACKLLYALCYRSETGQYNVLLSKRLKECMEVALYNHSGDPETLCQVDIYIHIVLCIYMHVYICMCIYACIFTYAYLYI
jgi:hypothetical protein